MALRARVAVGGGRRRSRTGRPPQYTRCSDTFIVRTTSRCSSHTGAAIRIAHNNAKSCSRVQRRRIRLLFSKARNPPLNSSSHIILTTGKLEIARKSLKPCDFIIARFGCRLNVIGFLTAAHLASRMSSG